MSNMNPMEAAWLLLKNPQQPTITDFTGYTRPQLEQMYYMFHNELMRRGRIPHSGDLDDEHDEWAGLEDPPTVPVEPENALEEVVSSEPAPPTTAPPTVGRVTPTPNVVVARLLEMGIHENQIQDEHIIQYQDFMRSTGRHPTEDEVNAHIG